MIDQSATARRQVPVQEEDAALDEARLRQQAIGVKLRQMFDQVVNEPVPDEFLDILRRADQRALRGKMKMSTRSAKAAQVETDGGVPSANLSRLIPHLRAFARTLCRRSGQRG